jgi:integrase
MPRRGHNEGSIYQRRDGRWAAALTVHLPTGGTRRKTFYGPTRKAVADKLRAAQTAAAAGQPVIVPRQTVAQFLDAWVTAKAAQVRPSTAVWYAQHCRLYLVPTLGPVQLTELTPQHVQACLDQWAAAGRSPRTVQHIRDTLRAALNQAVRWGLVVRNVATLVTPPRQPRPLGRAFTPEEARTFLARVAGTRWDALWGLALMCGLRQGEVLGLRWTDVDLEARTLTVCQALRRIGGTLQLVEPKTPQSRRTLVLPAPVVLALRAHRVRQTTERLAAPEWIDSGLVFTTHRGTPCNPNKVLATFHRLCGDAGLPAIRFHDLRHTCATLLLARNVPPKVVQEILGHTTIRTTLDLYSHVLPPAHAAAAETLTALLTVPDVG